MLKRKSKSKKTSTPKQRSRTRSARGRPCVITYNSRYLKGLAAGAADLGRGPKNIKEIDF